MKSLTQILFFTFIMLPVFSFAQNEMAVNSKYKTFSSSVNLEFTEKAAATDLLLNGYNLAHENDKCNTYKKMKTAGIVMTIAGSTAFAGGVALIIIGAIEDEENIKEHDVNGKVIAGIFTALGGGMTATAGIPLLIIGAVKSKKYCNGTDKTSMILGAHENGVGAKITF